MSDSQQIGDLVWLTHKIKRLSSALETVQGEIIAQVKTVKSNVVLLQEAIESQYCTLLALARLCGLIPQQFYMKKSKDGSFNYAKICAIIEAQRPDLTLQELIDLAAQKKRMPTDKAKVEKKTFAPGQRIREVKSGDEFVVVSFNEFYLNAVNENGKSFAFSEARCHSRFEILEAKA